MGQKRTPRLVSEAKRLRAEGRSFPEIAQLLSKPGKTLSEASIRGWLRPSTGSASQAEERTAAPDPAPRAAPADAEAPDIADMPPDELRALLAGAIRREQAEAERAMQEGRPGDARQSSRLVAVFAGRIQQIHARQNEDVETVRVKASDIQEAADRATAMLNQTADGVIAERATWPRCSGCGQPMGEFAAADVSPVRAMFERVCR
jgi:hypothetical protein